MDLSEAVPGWTHQRCGSCAWHKPLVGRNETRPGCMILLYGWEWRTIPDALVDAERVDVVDLVRRGETTREWIDVAVRMEEGSQACGFWGRRD